MRTAWEKAIVSAWLRRTLPPVWIPNTWNENTQLRGYYARNHDYHPARAQLIFRRWPHIIRGALMEVEP